MNHETGTIGPLMKVELKLQALSPETAERKSDWTSLFFIYGIGLNGITPFEKSLAGKHLGDQLRFEISAQQFEAVFGHLSCIFAKAIPAKPPWQLEIEVGNVAKAGDRELIKALAQTGGCEGGCGCGCC